MPSVFDKAGGVFLENDFPVEYNYFMKNPQLHAAYSREHFVSASVSEART